MTDTATISPGRPLWFEPFLQAVKRELGYPINIHKYIQLLDWADRRPWHGGESDTPFLALYGVCRVLFLENGSDEGKFRDIFMHYIVDELAYERSLAETPDDLRPGRDAAAVDKATAQTGNTADDTPEIPEPPDDETPTLGTQMRYINLSIPGTSEALDMEPTSQAGSRWIFSDAWMPLTRREMVHGWRSLRRQQQSRPGNRLDVPATVEHIAREGMLLAPVFEKEDVNSEDLLLILADRRGSMTAFHKLTDNLIAAATSEGGHRRALVYYFYNCPAGVVYERPNLTSPVRLEELYARIRPDHTNALIISDGGAGRGNFDQARLAATEAFLYGQTDGRQSMDGLHKRARFVAWLNPMPRHRWRDTTADAIAANPVTPMYTLMDDGYVNFLNTINKLMGK